MLCRDRGLRAPDVRALGSKTTLAETHKLRAAMAPTRCTEESMCSYSMSRESSRYCSQNKSSHFHPRRTECHKRRDNNREAGALPTSTETVGSNANLSRQTCAMQLLQSRRYESMSASPPKNAEKILQQAIRTAPNTYEKRDNMSKKSAEKICLRDRQLKPINAWWLTTTLRCHDA